MQKSCCTEKSAKNESKNIMQGLAFGILPHAFCIGFVIFSVAGSVFFTMFFKKALLIPYFFQILILISLAAATISAALYLRKNDCLCKKGIKSKWRYLAALYGATVLVNLLMFYVVMPMAVNADYVGGQQKNLSEISLEVRIPCAGHAPLITDELKKDAGIKNIIFKSPNVFQIGYASNQTSTQKILSMEIFKTFEAVIN